MQAVVLESHGDPLALRDVPEPDLEPDGVIVDVEACGICRSDWHAWKGHGEWVDDVPPEGQILGHEPAGTVLEVGDRIETLEEGDRVAVPFSLGDGTCSRCRNGHGNVCPNGTALGFEPAGQGAFADRIAVPHADYNLTTLPEGVSASAAAALGCRYMTAYHGLAHRADLAPGDWVAVHGCGGVGLSAVQIANALGARVLAVDVRSAPLEKATELGAHETVHGGGDVPGKIRELTGGGAAISIDALGISETCRNSVACLASLGQHLQLGLTTDAERGEVSLPTDSMVGREIDFLGSRGMPPTRYDELLGFVESGAIDPGALVSHKVPLAEVPERIAAMDEFSAVGIEVYER
ncbi:zinc-dependent alcohol dehydrogenase family protein [Halalkalicoccus jeotgali]|uniref:Alcohol dehydrogenase GroES domain protein n=1 Tax=Halalkalicoccus jeotgali (strain DSM 18796 / CECT 7217 / JCM 14584 / KCTC 4019 / B3) TaxID=795797 RepID=D8J3K8_HALJB|nr:zinc-dependent alcohol dehydrogenase family protein [Halalkalicoccus jeotgali]ADJ15315.1 Alcohol dehydrogenase GroES domain protein [Halalkalicoccus jeotgali B3]ELY35472.1 alcohol dehydrogenase GroES domain-containing protein [Halalkalicoccus jeotgali B3]